MSATKPLYALLNEKGECPTMKIPGRSGDFYIVSIFARRKDAETAMKSLPPAKRRIARVDGTMIQRVK